MAKKVKKTSKKTSAKKKAAKKKTVKKKAAKKTVKKSSVKKTAKKAAARKTAKKKSPVKKTVKKKTAVKKTASPKSTSKKSKKKSSLTAKEIEHFKMLLLDKRRELIGDVSHIESEALKKSRLEAGGDLSSMPIHMADMGTDNFEQEFSLGLMDSERKLLHEINCALQRIFDGVYGLCEGTSKEISKPRLEAKPWARYCIEYATMIEKGQVIEGEKIYDDDSGDFDDYIIEDEDEDEDELPEIYDLLDYEEMDDKEDEDY